MPVLVLSIAIDFNKLLQDGRVATITSFGKLRRVMIMAVHLAIVLVVAVLRPKDGRTDRTRKVLDMVFPVDGGNVGSSEGATTFVAEKVQSTKVVRFAKRILLRAPWFIHREELGRDDLAAVLDDTSQSRSPHDSGRLEVDRRPHRQLKRGTKESSSS